MSKAMEQRTVIEVEGKINQSKDLGHYEDSENAKHDFEDTGSRQIGEWCDFGNTWKPTKIDEDGCVWDQQSDGCVWYQQS